MWKTIKSIYGPPTSEVYWVRFFQKLWFITPIVLIGGTITIGLNGLLGLPIVDSVDTLMPFTTLMISTTAWDWQLKRNSISQIVGRMLLNSVLYWSIIWSYYVQLRGMSWSQLLSVRTPVSEIDASDTVILWLGCLLFIGITHCNPTNSKS